MPDDTHLRTLLSGPDSWDEWRIRNPGLAPDLRAARLNGRKLKGMDLSGADFRYATLDDADLSGADLRDARVELASLKEARLVRVSLDRARLAGANLEGADLSEASLVSADLRQTNLDRARLLNVDLRFAVLTRTKLHTADVSGCWIEDTVFAGCDLSRTAGLESLRHRGRSTISVETILLSRGIIPDTCLRNVGLPEALLTNRYALLDIMRPIQFQSCFISYSAKNQKLAERLHTDLQAVGVRVWFAPEDLKIGDEFRSQIERSISSYDRLLLVLSQNSIASSWV